jgi:undecaprenyl-diphosphatase
MDFVEALILGIVQGLSEFLPISSSAHLRIVPALAGWKDPGAAFTAVIQIGTLAAVLAYFREDILRIGRAWTLGLARGRPAHDPDARMGWMMIAGTVPIVVCGLLFQKQIETSLRSLVVIAGTMIGLAVLLAVAETLVRWRARQGRTQKHLENVSWPDALATGLAQAVALVPGASRSGVTITAGLFAGMSRETAARFSFLLSLPSVLAAGVFQLYKARGELLSTQEDVVGLAVATVVSGIVGYISIAFLLVYLKTHTTAVFIAYRLILGGLILFWLSNGTLTRLPAAGGM